MEACGSSVTTADTDLVGATRLAHGGALSNATEPTCCAACAAHAGCAAWLFASDGVPTRTGENCWLMANRGSGTVKKRGRLLGTASAPRPFAPTALSIELLNYSNSSAVWHAGDVARNNLGGTISSWNEVDPAAMARGDVQPGLLSRDGWSLVVDNAPLVGGKNASSVAGAATARFLSTGRTSPTEPAAAPAPWVDGSPWLAYPDSDEDGAAAAPYDAYFFGCGAEFRACLHDWSVLSGAVPLPPRQTVGVWWSKYDVFSAATIESLVLSQFAARSLPLDVLQMDVDWHFRNPERNTACAGYNGYDWNASLFPDPSAFVSTVRRGNWSNGGPQRALKLLLNTHSFEGTLLLCAVNPDVRTTVTCRVHPSHNATRPPLTSSAQRTLII